MGRLKVDFQFEEDRGSGPSSPATAGTLLRGTVFVEVHKPLKVRNNVRLGCLNLLSLHVYGKEKVSMNMNAAKKWAKKTGNTRAIEFAKNYPNSVERELFDVTIPLQEFPMYHFNEAKDAFVPGYDKQTKSIMAGTYTFPFEVQLPNNLPSSNTYNPSTKHQYESDDNNNNSLLSKLRTKPGFRIQYKICVKSKGFKDENLKSDPCSLWVSSAPEIIDRDFTLIAESKPAPHHLQDWIGCFSPGSIVTAAHLEDRRMSQSGDGRHLDLSIACRNNSSANIRRVQLKLIEIVEWGTGGIASTNNANDAVLNEGERLVLFAIENVDLSTIFTTGHGVWYKWRSQEFRNKREYQFLKEVREDLKSEQSKITVNVPHDVLLRASYCSQLVKVSHQIEIRFCTSSTRKDSVHTIIFPLQIVNTGQEKRLCGDVTETHDTTDHEISPAVDIPVETEPEIVIEGHDPAPSPYAPGMDPEIDIGGYDSISSPFAPGIQPDQDTLGEYWRGENCQQVVPMEAPIIPVATPIFDTYSSMVPLPPPSDEYCT